MFTDTSPSRESDRYGGYPVPVAVAVCKMTHDCSETIRTVLRTPQETCHLAWDHRTNRSGEGENINQLDFFRKKLNPI